MGRGVGFCYLLGRDIKMQNAVREQGSDPPKRPQHPRHFTAKGTQPNPSLLCLLVCLIILTLEKPSLKRNPRLSWMLNGLELSFLTFYPNQPFPITKHSAWVPSSIFWSGLKTRKEGIPSFHLLRDLCRNKIYKLTVLVVIWLWGRCKLDVT